MDTEEQREIVKLQHEGRPATDEGPYYHESWWESYKGGVKGTLGGLIIGAAIGAAAGAVIAGIAAVAAPAGIGLGTAGLIVAGVSTFGMFEGAHKFANVGVVTGAVAAAHEKAEERIKEFEGAKFAELQNEIRDLKSAITGNPAKQEAPAAEKPAASAAAGEEQHYRTQHCDDHCPPEGRKVIFWRIAAVGAAVGATAGGLIGASELAEHSLSHILGESAMVELHGASMGGLMAATGAVIGGTFGINRDIFRSIFDKTDRWFRGIISEEKTAPSVSIVQEQAASKAATVAGTAMPTISNPQADGKSPTFYQDKIQQAASRQALLSMDHTTSIRH